MELIQPYNKYILIGVATIIGVGIILWLSVVVVVMRNTKGIPIAISDFFQLILENKIDAAYRSTTDNFQSRISKPQFVKIIKKNKFKQYQRTLFGMPKMETGNNSILDVTLILKSGREIPLQFRVCRENKKWKIDSLEIT